MTFDRLSRSCLCKFERIHQLPPRAALFMQLPMGRQPARLGHVPNDEWRVADHPHRYFTDVIELPSTFEQLRTTSAGNPLRTLVEHLGRACSNPAIVNALLYVTSPIRLTMRPIEH